MWIGVTDASCPDIVNECWTWSDRLEFSYTNWNGGEPNDPQEDCGQLYAQGGNAWNDAGCGGEWDYVCSALGAWNSAILVQMALW